jgi:hypothetical protein
MLRKLLCLAATALVTQAATADVLYTWQQVQASPSMPDGLRIELLFSDAAVAKGSLALNVENQCSYGVCEEQQDSLLALRYWYAGADGNNMWNVIDYRYRDETQRGAQRLSMSLEFLDDGHLSGMIMANDGYSDFTLGSDGKVFTMLSAHSDQPWGCGFSYPSCSGEQGLLRASVVLPAEQPLPEPAAPATLAIGALAAWVARRRRKGAKSAQR